MPQDTHNFIIQCCFSTIFEQQNASSQILTLKSNDKYLMPSCRNIFPLNTWISDHFYFISSSLYQFYNILKLKTVLNFDIAEILLKLALNTNQSIDQVSLNMVFTCLNQTQ
jgi:hypothetical protein